MLFLSPTGESQGHGKPWETDILNPLGVTEKLQEGYNHTDIYDGRKEHTTTGRNLSIKTTKSMSLDCGDIIRFLTKCSDLDIIVIHYKQTMKKVKKAIKTYLINHDKLIEKLKIDIPLIYGITFKEWIDKIKDYDKRVKAIPHGEGECTDKSYLKEKEKLCDKIPYFNIAPKVYKKQKRVQCSINLNKIDIDETYDGGQFRDITYTKEIVSEPRNRNGQTVDDLKDICRDNGIKGFSKYKKNDLINYIKQKGYGKLIK